MKPKTRTIVHVICFCVAALLINAWVAHNLTIPPMPWRKAFNLSGLMLVVGSPAIAIMFGFAAWTQGKAKRWKN